MLRSILAAAVTVIATTALHANAAVYNFFDTTFTNPTWVGSIHADTSTPPASFTAGQLNVGGSPLLPGPQTPDHRQISHTYGGPGAGAIVVAHQGVPFNWSPLPLETATTVDYSYDLQYLDQITIGGAVGYAPAIFQGGNVYRTPYDSIFVREWTRFSQTGIPLASFNQIDTTTALLLPGTPNGAAAMSFGFVSANSANGVTTKLSGIDDFRFRLNTVIAPEPTTLAVITLTAPLLGRRRRA